MLWVLAVEVEVGEFMPLLRALFSEEAEEAVEDEPPNG